MISSIDEILDGYEVVETSRLYHPEHDKEKLKRQIREAILACKPKEIEEGDGWDIHFANGKEKGKERSCCPGDDIAYAHNIALDQWEQAIREALK